MKGLQSWTTQELLEVEARVIGGALARRHDRAGLASQAAVFDAVSARPTISDEQADMVAELCLSGYGIDVAVGAAGTGKTYALDAARAAWEGSGLQVRGAALSARAAAELQAGSGIESATIARLLAQLGAGRLTLDQRSVVVVDEAGMVGTRTLDRLSQVTADVGAKLVLVGDPEQLPEIEAGGAFRALTEHLDAVRLVENRRQIEPWERQALDDLRGGHVNQAVAAYDDRHRIVVVGDPDSLRQQVVQDWFVSHEAGESGLMIARHRGEVRDLNERARELLDGSGQLGPARVVANDREFAVGDRVMAVSRNHYDLDILNGDLGSVVHIDPSGAVTFVLDRSNEERTMPADRLAEGYLDHGYARINHKGQGATVDRTFTLGDDGDLDRQAAYTALSRERIENRLYVLEPELGPEVRRRTPSTSDRLDAVRDHVEQQISRDGRRQLASELLPPPVKPNPDPARQAPSVADDFGLGL